MGEARSLGVLVAIVLVLGLAGAGLALWLPTISFDSPLSVES